MTCEHCPCPATCLRWPVFCEWAATGDPVKLAHVRHRSAHEPEARPELARSIELTRRTNACPYRSRPPGCCAGGKCALRGGADVSHLDCFACLERYDPVTAPN